MSPERDEQAAAFETILVSLNPTGSPADGLPIRHVHLTADKPKLKIGRASKTLSKGLVPAVGNAYFDSPVVSRAHAEITGNFVDGSISVTDMGSLHGTSVNDIPLAKGVACVLEEDDIVSFGIHVSRGLDVFYPTACKVKLVRTRIKPLERARSYCAPDSEDGLSDASECDCSSVQSQSDLNASSAHNANSKPAYACDIDDDRTSQDSNVEDVTLRPEVELRSDYGENESDHDDGGVASYKALGDDDVVSLHSNDSDDMDEDGDDDDDEEEEVEDEEEEDKDEDENDENDEDDEGKFLDQELREFNREADLYSPPSPLLIKDPTPGGGDSLPVNGLWTPPSISAEDLASFAGPADDNCEGEHELAGEQTASNDAAEGKSLLLNDTVPRSVSAKFDISSILNPSPPTSSPPKGTVDDVPTVAPGAYFESQDINDAAIDMYDTLACMSTQEDERATALAKMPANVLHMSTGPAVPETQSDILLSPIVADIASRVGANDMTSFGVGSVSMEQRSSGSLLALESASGAFGDVAGEVDGGDNGTVDDEEEGVAMTSAATFLKYKKRKANKKRKAEEMLADAAASGTPVTPPTGKTTSAADADPSSQDGPAAKRQATPSAVAAKKKIKGHAWAAAEKIGIAALGGAVVLGTLIYTAPSF